MGIRIENNLIDTAASRGAQANYVSRLTQRAAAERFASGEADRASRREQVIQAGFGEDTVSVPGITIRTLNRNLLEARKAVPSEEALREEAEKRAAAQRAAVRERIEPLDIAARLQQQAARQLEPPEIRPPVATQENRPTPAPSPRPEPAVQRTRPEAAPQVRNFPVRTVQQSPVAPEGAPPQEPRSPAPGTPVTPARLDVMA